MRRIVIAIGSTLTGLVLLFSWPTSLNRSVAAESTDEAADTSGDASTDTSTSKATPTEEATPDATATAEATPTEEAAPTEEATPAAEATTGTYTGAAASTRYGDVQVQITVTDGVITAADAISYPDRDHESAQINSWAVPTLNDEVLAAQSAEIDMLSHATITSEAYVASLQDALDQAGL